MDVKNGKDVKNSIHKYYAPLHKQIAFVEASYSNNDFAD